jgi:hypothetical protein
MIVHTDSRRQDNPLHISLFPPYSDSTIEFSFLLNSCLDIFDIRCKQTSIDQDLGLLHAIDERLAAYGWLTTTGVKLLVIVDLFGQEDVSGAGKPAGSAINGLRDSDMKPVCLASMSSDKPSTKRSDPLIIDHRHFEHYRVRIFSFCRIHFTPRTTMYRFPETQRLPFQHASQSPIKSSLRMSNILAMHGLQVRRCRGKKHNDTPREYSGCMSKNRNLVHLIYSPKAVPGLSILRSSR